MERDFNSSYFFSQTTPNSKVLVVQDKDIRINDIFITRLKRVALNNFQEILDHHLVKNLDLL